MHIAGRTLHGTRGPTLLLLALTVALQLPAAPASPSLDHTGKWTPVTIGFPAWDWGYTSVHLSLVPGDINDGTPHSRLLWWEGAPQTEEELDGGIWTWSPGQNDDCDSSAALGFDEIELEGNPGFNVFCGSTGQLADTTARVVIFGGTEGGEIGVKKGVILNPNSPSSPWTAVSNNMTQARWYPVVTRLPNGELVVSSGSKYTLMHMFGGRPTGTSSNANSTLRRIGLSQDGAWEGNVTALPYSGNTAWQWPRAVQGHSFAWAQQYVNSGPIFESIFNRAVVFGGDSLNGSSQWESTFRTHFFETVEQRLASDEGYGWTRVQPNAGGNELVIRRAGHVMVTDATPDAIANKPGWIIFGGRRRVAGNADVFLNDVWTLRWNAFASPTPNYEWTPVTPDNASEAPPQGRFAAAGVFDPIHRRVLIYGGSADGSNPVANDSVYALNVSVTGDTLTWDRILPYAPAGRPSRRFGHAMLFDTNGRRRHEDGSDTLAVYFGALLHGGVDANGYSGEMWRLWVSPTNPDSLVWRQVAYDSSSTPPVARAFHVMVRDPSDRMIVFGGDVSGSADDDVWVSKLPFAGAGDHHFFEDEAFRYADLPTNSNPHSWSPEWGTLEDVTTDGSVSGAAAIAYSQPIFARIPDRYSANLSTRTAFPDSAALLQNWYPFTFVLPDGSLYTCGPFQSASDKAYRQPYPSAPWAWQEYPPGAASPGILPGSAAMWAPGKILIAGGSDINFPANSDSRSIDLSGAEGSPTWKAPINSMRYARNEHNLVILPNGQVMAVGGVNQHKGLSPILRPEIWRPDTTSGSNRGLWYITVAGESLAKQTYIRGYHSTAILLPDGRVLSTSGNEGENSKTKAELYCPPYLFNGDAQAARPVIADIVRSPWDHVPRLGYSRGFSVCLSGDTSGFSNNTITACLISPGAVTHQFDQNQRRVPLTVTTCNPSHRLDVATPADSNVAPPGFYMLFILNNKGVPSIAEWVLIGRDHQSGTVACGGCGGGGCPYVDLQTDAGWQTENTILGRSLGGELAFDGYRLRNVPKSDRGTISLRVRENEQEVTTLDEAKLLAVDHPPGLTVLGSGDGAVAGVRVPAYRVTHRGQEITNQVDGSEGTFGWHGSPGDTVLVELDGPQVGMHAQAVQEEGGGMMGGDPKEQDLRYEPGIGGSSAMKPAATPSLVTDTDWLRETGILVQRPDGQGGWSDATHWYPRQYGDESYFPGLGHGTTRLIFVGSHRLTFVGRLATASSGVTVQALSPASASHTRLGSVRPALVTADSTTTLAPGDTLGLTFAEPELAEGMERDYVLVTRGVYTSVTSPSRLQPSRPGLPLQFALLQNRPNPFGEVTTIQFELPVATKVKVEIFDLMGRRVRTLTDAQLPAGYHKVDWNRRTDSGTFVHAGVFSYRISAGSFQDTKKMVLLAR